MKKLLWLTQGSDRRLPSLRLRVLALAPWLDSCFKQTVRKSPVNLIQTLMLIPVLKSHDVVIVQKELVSLWSLLFIRLFAKRLLYDFDDAVWVRLRNDGEAKCSRKRSSRLRFLCRLCDGLIAGNSVLCEQAKKLGAMRVFVLPTAVELPREMPWRIKSNGHVITLGWIGTKVNLPYLEACESIFIRLKNKGFFFDVAIMSSVPPKFCEFKDYTFVEWSAEKESEFLSNIDVGLMPLLDNEHTQGKCAYKALQCMAYGKPVVVSDVGINKAWIGNGGFAVRNDNEWEASLECLIKDSELRYIIGSRARKVIERGFTREIIARKLKEIING